MAGIDSTTKLMLHCDGADASTTFTDSSLTPFTITANGNAQIDTAQSKFGGAAYLGDGTGDYLTAPDDAAWQLNSGTGPFTIDLWVRFNTLGNYSLVNHKTDGSNGYDFYFSNSGGQLRFRVYQGGYIVQVDKAWSPSTGTWYHLAVIRGWGGVNDDYALTVDGTQIGTTVSDATTIPDFSGTLNIMGNGFDIAGGSLDGWADEIRISTGAKWTANFTPETSAYSVASTTKHLALLGVG